MKIKFPFLLKHISTFIFSETYQDGVDIFLYLIHFLL